MLVMLTTFLVSHSEASLDILGMYHRYYYYDQFGSWYHLIHDNKWAIWVIVSARVT